MLCKYKSKILTPMILERQIFKHGSIKGRSNLESLTLLLPKTCLCRCVRMGIAKSEEVRKALVHGHPFWRVAVLRRNDEPVSNATEFCDCFNCCGTAEAVCRRHSGCCRGRWLTRPPHCGRSSCGLTRAMRLARPSPLQQNKVPRGHLQTVLSSQTLTGGSRVSKSHSG